MKRRFFAFFQISLLLFISLLNNRIHAQSFGAQLVAGLNFSQVDGDQYAGYNKVGLNTGVAVNREIKEKWLLQMELLYSGKGSRKLTSEEDMQIFALRYRYLEIPVLGIYQIREKLRLHTGPSIGFNIGAEFDDGREWMPANPPLLPYEVAGHLGAEYTFADNWAFSARHSLSLLRVGNPNNGTQFYRLTANGLYNRLFTFSLRYTVNGK